MDGSDLIIGFRALSVLGHYVEACKGVLKKKKFVTFHILSIKIADYALISFLVLGRSKLPLE